MPQFNGLTKQQVASLLCRVGVEAGFDVIPEYLVMDKDGNKQFIDVVWVRRPSANQNLDLCRTVAAFEIEGHCVHQSSINKNITSYKKLCWQQPKKGATRIFRATL